MTTITLSPKGQIVIPAQLRKKLGLKAGDQIRVEINENSNELVMKRAESIDEMSARIDSWIKPGIEPLVDTRAVFNTRSPRL